MALYYIYIYTRSLAMLGRALHKRLGGRGEVRNIGRGPPFGAYLEHLSSAPGGVTVWPRSKPRPGGGRRRPLDGLKCTFDTMKLRSVTQLGRILAHRGRPRSRENSDFFTILDAPGGVLDPLAAPKRVFERSWRPNGRATGGGDPFSTPIWSF